MNKKGDIKDYMPWLIIGLIVLVIGVLGILLIKGKLGDNLSFAKNLFKFGRA